MHRAALAVNDWLAGFGYVFVSEEQRPASEPYIELRYVQIWVVDVIARLCTTWLRFVAFELQLPWVVVVGAVICFTWLVSISAKFYSPWFLTVDP